MVHLLGVLRMIETQHAQEPLEHCELNEEYVKTSHTILQNRRGKHRLDETDPPTTTAEPHRTFKEHVLSDARRFVCFLVVQEPFSDRHSLSLRNCLADRTLQKEVTIFIATNTSNPNSVESRAFRTGTGFTLLPFNALLQSILNITQMPMVVILDTKTGRPLSNDAVLALEWNCGNDDGDHDDCVKRTVEAWKSGRSGLSASQKTMAMATLQSSSCTIQ